MNSRGQFVTIFFSVLLIGAIIAIFNLEYTNLTSNQNINLAQSQTTASNAIMYNILQQYSFFRSLAPSSEASSFLSSSITTINQEYFSNYVLNLSGGPSLSGSFGSTISTPFIPLQIINTQSLATSNPFQQVVVVNSSAYSMYEAPNLQNVQFAYQNGTIIPSWLESGNLATFDGADSYVNIPDSSVLDPSSVTEIAWVYANAQTGSDRVIGKGGSGNSGNEYDIFITTNYLLGARFKNTTTSNFMQTSSAVITPDTWEMVAATYNSATGTATLYVNGQEVLSGSPITGSLGPASTPLRIGCCVNNGTNQFFNGSIADVQVYGSALTAAQIQQIYASGMGGSPLSSVVGWWPLAGNANDASGNGNDGVTTNVAYIGAGVASTSTIYWLKFGSLPANSKTTIDMNFYPKSYNEFNTINTGEAPALSQTYGGYDDGAKVFNAYWNFSGTSLPNGFSNASSTGDTYVINNGLWLYKNSALTGNYARIDGPTYTSQNGTGAMWYSVNDGGRLIMQPTGQNYTYQFAINYQSSVYSLQPYAWSGAASYYPITSGSTTELNPSLLWYTANSGNIYASIDGSTLEETTTQYNRPSPSQVVLLDGTGGTATSSAFFQNLFIFSVPPNNVMPTVVFGELA